MTKRTWVLIPLPKEHYRIRYTSFFSRILDLLWRGFWLSSHRKIFFLRTWETKTLGTKKQHGDDFSDPSTNDDVDENGVDDDDDSLDSKWHSCLLRPSCCFNKFGFKGHHLCLLVAELVPVDKLYFDWQIKFIPLVLLYGTIPASRYKSLRRTVLEHFWSGYHILRSTNYLRVLPAKRNYSKLMRDT